MGGDDPEESLGSGATKFVGHPSAGQVGSHEAGSVGTNDVRRAVRPARGLQAGPGYVNTYRPVGVIGAPFGGYKKSGFGRTRAADIILEYTGCRADRVKFPWRRNQSAGASPKYAR